MTQVAIVGAGVVGCGMRMIFPDALMVDQREGHATIVEARGLDLGIVCVPTPMGEDGACDTSIVESVVHDLQTELILIKSTVTPGTVNRLKEITGKRIAFSPEYMGESKYWTPPMFPDPLQPIGHGFMIIGGDAADCSAIADIFMPRLGPATRYRFMTSTEAELVKYFENSYFALKVTFANEIRRICEAMNVNYHVVREGWLDDPRVGLMHTAAFKQAPGFHGKCLERGTPVSVPGCGTVAIEHLKIGDKVLDAKGVTVVTGKHERTVLDTIKISVRGIVLRSSVDHLHLVAKESKGERSETRADSVEIGDYVLVSRPPLDGMCSIAIDPPPQRRGIKWWPQDTVTLDPSWARVIGLYLAEGCSGQYGKKQPTAEVIWAFGESAENLADETQSILQSKGIHASKRLQVSASATYGVSTCWIVRTRSAGLLALFDALKLGRHALVKGVPDLHADLALSVVGGWLDGDGNQSGGSITGWSESTQLITGLWRLLAKCGICASISHDGRRLNISRREDVGKVLPFTRRFKANEYVRNEAYESQTMRSVDTGWMVKVTKLEREQGECDVVSIETESGRYLASSIETHNCLPKDIAALASVCRSIGIDPVLLNAVIKVNG